MKGFDLQGWMIQCAICSYPRAKRKKCQPTAEQSLAKAERLFNKKCQFVDKLILDKERSDRFPLGRVAHIGRQVDRLEFYLGKLTDMGGSIGRISQSAL